MNLIFDFDGTICDSFNLNLKIANEYLTRFKKKLIDSKEFREKGIEEIIKDYKLNKLQILIYIYRGRRELAKHISELETFEGMPEVIKKLSGTNRLGILSSNSKKNIEIFLKNNNLDKYFDFIQSNSNLFGKAETLKKLKPDFYIGDEVRDIEAAKKVGIKSIAVSWGFAGKNLLKKYKPDYLISDPKALLSMGK
jgi:phosphoglycolate phosphatase